MKISVDHYEKDIIMETLQYRLENDNILLIDGSLKDDLEDLLSRLEEPTLDWEKTVIYNLTVAWFEL